MLLAPCPLLDTCRNSYTFSKVFEDSVVTKASVIMQERQKANELQLKFRHFTGLQYVYVTNKSS